MQLLTVLISAFCILTCSAKSYKSLDFTADSFDKILEDIRRDIQKKISVTATTVSSPSPFITEKPDVIEKHLDSVKRENSDVIEVSFPRPPLLLTQFQEEFVQEPVQFPPFLAKEKQMAKYRLMAMEKGVQIDGHTGGYHRALGGGYQPPHQFDPYNVHWHSYRDEGRQIDMDTFRYRRYY